MVNESFIKACYTNLCKDKDSYFYNILKKDTYGEFTSQPNALSSSKQTIPSVTNSMECKKMYINI